jgi:hypothetical protein
VLVKFSELFDLNDTIEYLLSLGFESDQTALLEIKFIKILHKTEGRICEGSFVALISMGGIEIFLKSGRICGLHLNNLRIEELYGYRI